MTLKLSDSPELDGRTMTPLPAQSRSRQPSLQNRSFRYQRLDGANFAGADLRGCDFSGASMQGVCLDWVKTGASWLQWMRLLGWLGVGGFLFADALAHLVFGALGRTPDEAGWSFVVALYLSAAIAGLGGLFPLHLNRLSDRLRRVTVGIWLGALPGFFYGGVLSQNDPKWAIACAVAGGLLSGIIAFTLRSAVRWSTFLLTSAIAAYAFAFLMGNWALAFYTAGELFPGLALSLLATGYVALCLMTARRALRLAQCSLGTSFRYADLTDASFDMADLSGANFEGAIGVPDWDADDPDA